MSDNRGRTYVILQTAPSLSPLNYIIIVLPQHQPSKTYGTDIELLYGGLIILIFCNLKKLLKHYGNNSFPVSCIVFTGSDDMTAFSSQAAISIKKFTKLEKILY